MTQTFDREQMRTYILHTSRDELSVVCKLVNVQVAKLLAAAKAAGFDLPAKQPFSPAAKDVAFPVNLRSVYDWIEAVSLPEESDRSPGQHQNELRAENVELLLEVAATLKQRWGE